jgi:hypothetical protein
MDCRSTAQNSYRRSQKSRRHTSVRATALRADWVLKKGTKVTKVLAHGHKLEQYGPDTDKARHVKFRCLWPIKFIRVRIRPYASDTTLKDRLRLHTEP